jgi:hypothetical protein
LPASIESWELAISSLPENPSLVEQRHRTQYEAALKSAQEAQYKFERQSKEDHNVIEMRNTGDNPWEVAATMIGRWEKEGSVDQESSAWLIHEAHSVSSLLLLSICACASNDWSEFSRRTFDDEHVPTNGR